MKKAENLEILEAEWNPNFFCQLKRFEISRQTVSVRLHSLRWTSYQTQSRGMYAKLTFRTRFETRM